MSGGRRAYPPKPYVPPDPNGDWGGVYFAALVIVVLMVIAWWAK